MNTEQIFEQITVAITEEIELRIEEDREEGFDVVLQSVFKAADKQNTIRTFSPVQQEALLRMTHALLVIGEYGDELCKQMPEHEVDELIDELHEYCYASLIEPHERILEPVADSVEMLFAQAQ